jgi:hypothetical protein
VEVSFQLVGKKHIKENVLALYFASNKLLKRPLWGNPTQKNDSEKARGESETLGGMMIELIAIKLLKLKLP